MDKFLINEDEVFAVNENIKYTTVEFGPSNTKVVIADNFYKNPDLVRNLAIRIPPSKNQRIRNNLPGGRINAFYLMDHMGPIFDRILEKEYPQIWLHFPQGHIKRSFRDSTFMVNVMSDEIMEPRTPHIDHPDFRSFAAMIYLNTPEECSGGTGFYTFDGKDSGTETRLNKTDNHYTPMFVNGDMGDWKMTNMIEMKYNRMVLYQSKYYHAAYIEKDKFVNGLYRLNQMFFI